MTEHTATVTWERDGALFTDNRYSRAHRWRFDGGAEVAASSSPHVVPVPLSDAGAVDPEEAFVASVSSCHMLWFLSLAAAAGHVVESYVDRPVGAVGRDGRGRQSVTAVTLRPDVAYSGLAPTAVEERALHGEAHERCFIANSVRSEVTVAPQ